MTIRTLTHGLGHSLHESVSHILAFHPIVSGFQLPGVLWIIFISIESTSWKPGPINSKRAMLKASNFYIEALYITIILSLYPKVNWQGMYSITASDYT